MEEEQDCELGRSTEQAQRKELRTSSGREVKQEEEMSEEGKQGETGKETVKLEPEVQTMKHVKVTNGGMRPPRIYKRTSPNMTS